MSSAADVRVARTLGHLLPASTAGTGPKAPLGKIGATAISDDDVCILSYGRTAMGSLSGALSGVPATKLGSEVVRAVLKRAGVDPADQPQEVIMGCVLPANVGQAPARQVCLGAGLPDSTICTTVNKVCASGLKAIMLAANEIRLGNADRIVAGGIENMSQVPYYAPAMRTGARIGDTVQIDGMMKDGLTDPYGKYPMGCCAEVCAEKFKLSREAQDKYAEESYRRAQAATKAGKFKAEIVPVEVAGRKGKGQVVQDEEVFKVDLAKLSALKPVFRNPLNPKAPLTVTAGNASVISDGAAAVYLASGRYVREHGLESKVQARIISYADAEQAPLWFTTAPAAAIDKALKSAGVGIAQVDAFEINEAFAAVALANVQLLGLDPAKVNPYGGAVALGHPLGASGARIVCTLLSVLRQEKTATSSGIGVAAICNGGGGASALVLQIFN